MLTYMVQYDIMYIWRCVVGDQNRKIYRIRKSGQGQTDPGRIKSLRDLEAPRLRAATLGPVDDSLHASAEDIDAYRRDARRQ